MENRLYLANHPDTWGIIFPLFHFFEKHPEVSLVCWNVIGRLFFNNVSTIPVSTRSYTERAIHRKVLERLFVPKKGTTHQPVYDAMRDTLEQGKSLLVFPAGAPPNRGEERVWRTGVARLLQDFSMQGISLPITFLHMHSVFFPPQEREFQVDPSLLLRSPENVMTSLRHTYRDFFPEVR